MAAKQPGDPWRLGPYELVGRLGHRLLQFATQVAQALTAIHAAGIVHRDLKPTTSCSRRARGQRFGSR